MSPDPLDPAEQDSALSPSQRQTLQQAQNFLSSGQPGEAARLFARLAESLNLSNRPRRAANLHAQAAHAFADSHNESAALTQARAALTLFVQNRMAPRIPVFYANITRKLANRGMPGAAEALAKEFGARVGALPAPVTPPAEHATRLPTSCPKCGAPLRSTETHWVDADTAECAYCGALVRPAA